MDITIYHNPSCGTSREVLEKIRSAGEDPRIIEYLKTPPSREELATLIKALGISARDLLRTQESAYGELGLERGDVSDERIIEALHEHPILMNRPVVRTPLGTRLCRPAGVVAEILPGAGPAT
jgi:arsenate reductase